MPLISLVGLPGSGKSTIGRRIARRLDLTFLDVDREIERGAGLTIAALFERDGETRFRDVEERMITRLLSRERAVVATGGGAVLRETTRKALNAGSTVVYLRCLPEELRGRVRDDGRRPLFAGVDVDARMRSLFEQRDALYAEAAHIVVEGERRQYVRVMTALEPFVSGHEAGT